MIITIKDIYRQAEKFSKLEKIKVGGWVKSVRAGKEKIFITLNDGSTLDNLQIIAERESPPGGLLEKVNFSSCLLVSGRLLLTPQRSQPFELVVSGSDLEIINSTADDYPLQKKNIPLNVVRESPHLRAKTNYFLVLFRLRHSISKAIHDFFHQEGFYYIPTPIITNNDAEGAGETFIITIDKKEPFFSQPANLTVSVDLQSEHEKYLCEHFDNNPVFITNYPADLKAFYMKDRVLSEVKNNPDKKTAACFDLLFPEIGELIGGSLREDNYQTLQEKAKQKSLNIDNLIKSPLSGIISKIYPNYAIQITNKEGLQVLVNIQLDRKNPMPLDKILQCEVREGEKVNPKTTLFVVYLEEQVIS
ncbi:14741_t:CDS:2, partial [Cetraspora pellucida]